jgi:hypothetical protein
MKKSRGKNKLKKINRQRGLSCIMKIDITCSKRQLMAIPMVEIASLKEQVRQPHNKLHLLTPS